MPTARPGSASNSAAMKANAQAAFDAVIGVAVLMAMVLRSGRNS